LRHLDQGSFSRWVARIGRHKQALYRVVTVQTHTHVMCPGPDLEPEEISAAMRQKMGGTMTITLAPYALLQFMTVSPRLRGKNSAFTSE